MIMDQDGTADFANLGIVDMRWDSSSRANSMSFLSIYRCFVKRKRDLRTMPPDKRYSCTVFVLLCGKADLSKGYWNKNN